MAKFVRENGTFMVLDEDGRITDNLPSASPTYYPRIPNVKQPEGFINDPGVEVVEEEPHPLDDGFQFGDIPGLVDHYVGEVGERVGPVAAKVAVTGAAAGVALTGIVAAPAALAAPADQPVASQEYHNQAAADFAATLSQQETAVMTTRTAAMPTDGKAQACLRAEAKVDQLEKRVDRLEGRDAPAKKVRKAKKALGKWENRAEARCDVDAAAGIKRDREWFWKASQNLESDADVAAYMAAVDAVSGDNWTDQSHLPETQRVGFPPGTPAEWVAAAKNEGGGINAFFTIANRDTVSWHRVEGTNVVMAQTRSDLSPSWNFSIAMPDGTMRGTYIRDASGWKLDDLTLGADGYLHHATHPGLRF